LVIINGTISPQDNIIKIRVSKSTSSLDNNSINNLEVNAIKNAEVSISDKEQNSMFLDYSEIDFNYQTAASNFLITVDKQYFLKL